MKKSHAWDIAITAVLAPLIVLVGLVGLVVVPVLVIPVSAWPGIRRLRRSRWTGSDQQQLDAYADWYRREQQNIDFFREDTR